MKNNLIIKKEEVIKNQGYYIAYANKKLLIFSDDEREKSKIDEVVDSFGNTIKKISLNIHNISKIAIYAYH